MNAEHYKEFLLSPVFHVPRLNFIASQDQACVELAVTCLTYLAFDDFASGPISDDLTYTNFDDSECGLSPDLAPHDFLSPRVSKFNVSKRLKSPTLHDYPFLEFAAISWPIFVRSTDESNIDIWKAFYKLALLNKQLNLAFQILSSTKGIRSQNTTAMLFSTLLGFRSFVDRLLEIGVDINAQTEYYGTALHVGANEGHQAVVQLPIDAGADVKAQTAFHGTALHVAAGQGHQAIVRSLIDAGADVNARGGHFDYALHAAAYKGNETVVRTLVDAGADIKAGGGDYALHTKANEGHGRVAIWIAMESGPRVIGQCRPDSKVLQIAAQRGQLAVVRYLVENGDSVSASDWFNGTALQAAADYGHEAVVRWLIENGADVNAKNWRYLNALQAARDCGHKAVVRLLIENGANDYNVPSWWTRSGRCLSVQECIDQVDLLFKTVA
jgi:ankyrin repeat protein